MPGLVFADRFAAAPSANQEPLARALTPALQACRFDQRYGLHPFIETPGRQLVSVAYESYPVAFFETRRYRLVLEGRLYSVQDHGLKDELTQLAQKLFADRQAQTRDWLLSADGSFLFFAEEKDTGRWAFLNDALGRLPTYYWQTETAFFLARSFPFFARLSDGPRSDPLGIAQQLLYGFPIGARTLLKGVRRMASATLLCGAPGRPCVEAKELHTFSLEERPHRPQTLQENGRALAGYFREACSRRSDAPNVLALSGGLDSRAVAFAFQRERLPLERLTFRRHGGANDRDVEGAEAVARLCKISGTTLPLAPPTGHHCARLLRATGGLNRFDVAYVVAFLERARHLLSSSTNLLTGDGSVPLRPPPSPPRAARSVRDLALHLADRNLLPSPVVARLTGVAKERLLDSLCQRLATYPESSLAQKHTHFALFERLPRFSFVGEDRNRHYFWQSAPFYNLPFFKHAMGCPDEQKARFALFREMLLQLSPRALDVGYADFLGTKMTPLRYRAYTLMRGLVRRLPPLKRFIERQLHRRPSVSPDAALLRCLRCQVRRPAVADPLDARALSNLLDAPDALSQKAWSNLLTATSFLEWRSGGMHTLSDFADVPLV